MEVVVAGVSFDAILHRRREEWNWALRANPLYYWRPWHGFELVSNSLLQI